MSAAEQAAAERRERLRELGVAPSTLETLTEATASPYADLEAPRDPLADEPCAAAWRDYAAEARDVGAATVLRRRIVQLSFPIREGISEDRAYRAAVLAGASPPLGSGIRFEDPEGVAVEVHPTLAGAVPTIVARSRRDFETLVRALTARNEPVAVPESMGACLVRGLVNQDRVHRYRRAWAVERGGDDPAAWKEAFREMARDKPAYQDRVLVLSSGPYSAVDAGEAGRDAGSWQAESLRIRREHECFHYLTLRLADLVRSDLLDEVAADLAGLVSTRGAYDAALALRFLGLDAAGAPRPDARARIYRGELDEGVFPELTRIAARAVLRLGEVLAHRRDLVESGGSRLPLTVAALGLPALASPDLEELLEARLSP